MCARARVCRYGSLVPQRHSGKAEPLSPRISVLAHFPSHLCHFLVPLNPGFMYSSPGCFPTVLLSISLLLLA